MNYLSLEEHTILHAWMYLWKTYKNNESVSPHISEAIDILRIAWIGFGKSR